MKLMNICAVIALSGLFVSVWACPAHERCKAIKDPAERLKCFDEIDMHTSY